MEALTGLQPNEASFIYLLAEAATVHPQSPPSDMTSSALRRVEQRPPQKLPLTLWHYWASSLPVH